MTGKGLSTHPLLSDRFYGFSHCFFLVATEILLPILWNRRECFCAFVLFTYGNDALGRLHGIYRFFTVEIPPICRQTGQMHEFKFLCTSARLLCMPG
jgi:hypothetical protein